MTHIVTRTCTEVLPDGEGSGDKPESKPLRAFRSEPAYVLLGDPGLGKTTAFKYECEALGDAAFLIDARDFLASDPRSHPEWRGRTLFIDGLDEVRAGLPDGRTPLDKIRRHLDTLGRPHFRISCREADWLGENDRGRLDFVVQDSKVAVVRLDPLTGSDIEKILGSHLGIDDPQIFIKQAQEWGVDSLLANPQTLKMLADVVSQEEGWPESRLETFELACRNMAKEQNEEHVLGRQQPPFEQVLDAAGYLCAAQLITGAAGHSLEHGDTSSDYINLADCDYASRAVLHRTLDTKLFHAVGERRFAPVHRHVAEFVGARYLARRIGDGLPARRVLSLINGADGVVVTEMRGLSGWLAAHPSEARDLLIERDPIGVALYGDIRGFSTEEKCRLLKVLGRREVLTQLWRKTQWYEIGSTFGALASPDMETVIGDALTGRSRDPSHQNLVQFVLTLLRQGNSLSSLAPALLEIVRDNSWRPYVKYSALDAFLHTPITGDDGASELRQLLEEIRAGDVADPDNELLGALLEHLYPKVILPSRIWEYLTDGGDSHLIGHYILFWEQRLLDQSSDQDVAELLDELSQCLSDAWPALEFHHLDTLPLRLLSRGLAAHGDDMATSRLYDWLSSAALPDWQDHNSLNESLLHVRAWLEQRPEVQKAVLLEGLQRCPDSDLFYPDVYEVWRALHGSSLPSDFGLWCLDQAVAVAPVHSKASEELLALAHRQLANDQTLSLDVLSKRIRGYEGLEKKLSVLLRPPDTAETERTERVERHKAKEAREREKGMEYVRANAEDLHENRAPLGLLRDLGRAYFLYQRGRRPLTSTERLSELLGHDDDLVDAALAGLRGTVWRSDVPDCEEIIRLKEASRMHLLAFPFLAGLQILQQEDPERLVQLGESRMRTGLAFHYCTPVGLSETPAWHATWTDLYPETVAEVAAKCLLSAVRQGDGYSPGLEDIQQLTARPDLRHKTNLRVLAKFPLRAGRQDLTTLDRLLWNALEDPDRSSLLELIDLKLSLKSMAIAQRVRWLAAGTVAAPEAYAKRMEEFVRGRERRVRELAAFFDSSRPLPSRTHEHSALTLKLLIELMGCSFAPTEMEGFVTLEMQASGQIDRFIQQLGSLPGEDALQALDSLESEPGLSHWRDRLERARDDQRVVHRDAAYRYPDFAQLHRALKDQEPANAGDLAALVLDRLSTIASVIRTGNADEWRQYWNEDSHGRPEKPKHEDSCRDALLFHLRQQLPTGLDAQPEGQYAGDARSDIRIAYGNCNVPVEIKKDTHRDLWSAIKNQLIGKYTRDVETSGYGIYLVLWFGDGGMPPPPRGTRPTTPQQLQQRLEETLTAEEAFKISVVVLDVSPVQLLSTLSDSIRS
ncbi:MAG: hypothetical protein OXG19_09735 [Chloroflexi bacterium]|nr:hypothetical protein [Chloroflexota bacterium]